MKTVKQFIKSKDQLKEAETKPRQRALLAVGTNDWDDEEKAYKGAKEAIQRVKDRGEDPVVVLPNRSVRGKGHAHAGASRAAQEHGAETHYPSEFGKGDDHYHLTQKAADEIKAKYPGARAYGDSNSIRLGAKEGDTGFTGKGGSYIANRIGGTRTTPTTQPAEPPKPPKNIDVDNEIERRNVERLSQPSRMSDQPRAVYMPEPQEPRVSQPSQPRRQADTSPKSTEAPRTTMAGGDHDIGGYDMRPDEVARRKSMQENEDLDKVNAIAKELKSMAGEKKLPDVNAPGVPDMFKINKDKKLQEEGEGAPANSAGGGNIASIGVPNPAKGANFGEPGFSPAAMSKYKKRTKKGQEDIEQDLAMMRRAQPALVGGKLMEARMGKFAGHDTFIVPSDVYHKARHEKRKGKHWRTYIGEDDCGCAIREYASKNKKKPIILQDENTGAMCYARYGKK